MTHLGAIMWYSFWIISVYVSYRLVLIAINYFEKMQNQGQETESELQSEVISPAAAGSE